MKLLAFFSLIITALYAILPTSPIQKAIAEIDAEMSSEMLAYLNWFIPFDTARDITLIWLNCILAYYTFTLVKKIVMDYIIGKLIA